MLVTDPAMVELLCLVRSEIHEGKRPTRRLSQTRRRWPPPARSAHGMGGSPRLDRLARPDWPPIAFLVGRWEVTGRLSQVGGRLTTDAEDPGYLCGIGDHCHCLQCVDELVNGRLERVFKRFQHPREAVPQALLSREIALDPLELSPDDLGERRFAAIEHHPDVVEAQAEFTKSDDPVELA